jgi:hypothetical protein
MAYGLRYTADFDSLSSGPLDFTVQIYEDGYVGASQTITLGPNPAIQEWQDDEPKKAIKGCTMTLEIINDGTIKLDDFYSENDNQFRVELIWNATGETLFVGYVLQDDCSEIMVDYAHIIKIVATDNLGLIKDVTLDQASVLYGVPTTYTISNFNAVNNQFLTDNGAVSSIQAGDKITITNVGAGYDGVYYCLDIEYDNFLNVYRVTLNNTFATGLNLTGDWTWNNPVDLTGYVNLLSLITLCIKATNIELSVRVLSDIIPIGGTTQRWLDDTYIKGSTFFNNNVYDDCYVVLEKILSRFYATCFKSKGFWYILRWNELYKIEATSFLMIGYVYNSDFVYQVDYTEDPRIDFDFSVGKPVESGIIKSIERPFIFCRDSFNYVIDQNLIFNEDLQIVGNLVNNYTSGGNTIFEYEVPWWQVNQTYPVPNPTRYIRVVYNSDGEEIDRFLVILGAGFSAFGALQSQDIFVSQDDVLNYSYDVRTDISIPGPNDRLKCLFELTNGTTTYYLDNNGNWQTTFSVFTGGLRLSIVAGDNCNNWHTFSVEAKGFPIDGVCRVYLGTPLPSPAYVNETLYKNFKFRLTNNIARNADINGQSHTFSQFTEIKNFQKRDISLDNSPRSSIKGTLYLSTYTGLIRNRCTNWKYKNQTETFGNLGQLMTIEELYSRYIPRYKYQMNTRFINDASLMMSNFIAFWSTNAAFNNTNLMVPGSVSIDYKNNVAEFSFYEIAYNIATTYDSWQMFVDFYTERLYEFKYLYENR